MLCQLQKNLAYVLMILFNEIMLLANSQLFENCELIDIQIIQCLISKQYLQAFFFWISGQNNYASSC